MKYWTCSHIFTVAMLERRTELAVAIFKTENAYLQSITSFVHVCSLIIPHLPIRTALNQFTQK